jgi:hypothetical protein
MTTRNLVKQEVILHTGLIITEAKNAMAELEKDGAQWIESYREW